MAAGVAQIEFSALARRVALAALVTLGVWNTIAAARAGSPGTLTENVRVLASTKGYDYQGYFAKLLPRLTQDGVPDLQLLLAFDEPDRELLYADMAMEGFRRPGLEDGDVFEVLSALDSTNLEGFAHGLGPYLSRSSARNLDRSIEHAQRVPGPLGEAVLEGVGRFGVDFRATPEVLSLIHI